MIAPIASLKKQEIVWLSQHRCVHKHTFLEHYSCFPGRKAAKVLFINIETSPNLGWGYGKYETTFIKYEKEWVIMCFGYKWLGGKTEVVRGPEHHMVEHIRRLLDEADVVIAHNGDKFDLRKINTRIAYYSIQPPSKYKSIDTLKKVRKHFGLNSNSLGDVGEYFGLGKKLEPPKEN